MPSYPDIAGSASVPGCNSKRWHFGSRQGVGKPVYTAKSRNCRQRRCPVHWEGGDQQAIDDRRGQGTQTSLGCWRSASEHRRAQWESSCTDYSSTHPEKAYQAKTLLLSRILPGFTLSEHNLSCPITSLKCAWNTRNNTFQPIGSLCVRKRHLSCADCPTDSFVIKNYLQCPASHSDAIGLCLSAGLFRTYFFLLII